ncbi:helicase domain protein [Nitzschia inconspicua]|uniref:Helicase domain protein n=1 Tax=Nitzschia inconspicua TaxID=303405 RepID=A0A9K3M3W6_9STRA|nr:helicase domain protein [Nitzschia inconspicua]
MDLFLSTDMHSNGVSTIASRQDLDDLLSFLNRAEEIVTSGTTTSVVKGTTDYDDWRNDYSLLEPTPIRPDHEMTFPKQHQREVSVPKTVRVDEFGASVGSSFSGIFSNVDDEEPLDLDEAILAPIVVGSLNKDHSSSLANKNTFFLEVKTTSHDTSDDSAAPVRFRTYQKCQWDDRFQELLIFHQKHGHLLVPHSYPPNQKLAQWVKRQRHQYKRKRLGHHSTLTDEREVKLSAVGFIFDSHRAVWYARYETLKSFFLANGHCGVPAKYEDGSLNVWIKHQRRQYLLFMNGEKSTMTEERIAALNSIGFNWNPRNFVRPNNNKCY